jgi:alpha-D-ribose 1-methylphosphonate 5-triphosphate synthase subunit PhnH
MNHSPVLHQWRHGSGDPAVGSHQAFRAILDAMEHPGRLVTIREFPYAPAILNSASAATCLTLLDDEMTVWTDIDWRDPAIGWLQSGCGSSVVTEPSMAKFAVITKPAAMPPLEYFRVGRHEDCEKATTIVVQVEDIYPAADHQNCNVAGNRKSRLELKDVADIFWCQWRQLSFLHPMGIDIFFTCDDVLTALPKMTRIEP